MDRARFNRRVIGAAVAVIVIIVVAAVALSRVNRATNTRQTQNAVGTSGHSRQTFPRAAGWLALALANHGAARQLSGHAQL